MPGRTERIVLLHSSPRLPAGLLTARAWDLLRSAPVYAGADSPQVAALRTAGVTVTVLDGSAAGQVDVLLAAGAPTVVWLAGPDGDLPLARALSQRLIGATDPPVLEAEYGSWDPPGARLLDAVAVLDRLRTGCPWDREQTHESLAPYLLEEAYEAYDAIGSGDRAHLREELGDVLLQVLFHARLGAEVTGAAEEGAARFDIDEVAGGLVNKLVRRHPHVFGDVSVSGVDEVHRNWEQIKRAEKARESSMDGVPLGQPALSLVDKLLSRAERAGIEVPAPTGTDLVADGSVGADTELGRTLFELVTRARRAGLDPEAALRRTALRYAAAVRAAEKAGAEQAGAEQAGHGPAGHEASESADPSR